MTIWYVDDAIGNDNYDGTSMTRGSGNIGPKKTITGGMNNSNVASGDTIEVKAGTYSVETGYYGVNIEAAANCANKTITIQPYQSGVVNVTLTGTEGVRVTASGCSIIFNHINITTSNGGTTFIRFDAAANSNLTFNYCTLTMQAARNYFVYFPAFTGAQTRTLIFNQCTITAIYSTFGFLLDDIYSLSILGGSATFTANGGTHTIYPRNSTDFSYFKIDGVTLTVTSAVTFFYTESPNTISSFIFNNNTVVQCGNLIGFVGTTNCEVTRGEFRNNNISCAAQNAYVVYFGSSSTDSANKEYGLIITGNKILNASGTGNSHGLHLGKNTRNCYVGNNLIDNGEGDYGIVNKGLYNIIENNVVIAEIPLYICDGQYSAVKNNTFICSVATGKALSFSNAYGREPLYNDIQRNIFYAAVGVHAACIDAYGVNDVYFNDNHLDYNIYYGGTESYVRVGNVNYHSNDLAALIAAWPNLTTLYTNDVHSLFINPTFFDVANDKYIPTNHDVWLADKTYIGSVQPSLNTPEVSNVRDGISYELNEVLNLVEGTLDLPASSDVRFGVEYDNGTSEGTSTPAVDELGRVILQPTGLDAVTTFGTGSAMKAVKDKTDNLTFTDTNKLNVQVKGIDTMDVSSTVSVNAKLLGGATPNNISSTVVKAACASAISEAALPSSDVVSDIVDGVVTANETIGAIKTKTDNLPDNTDLTLSDIAANAAGAREDTEDIQTNGAKVGSEMKLESATITSVKSGLATESNATSNKNSVVAAVQADFSTAQKTSLATAVNTVMNASISQEPESSSPNGLLLTAKINSEKIPDSPAEAGEAAAAVTGLATSTELTQAKNDIIAEIPVELTTDDIIAALASELNMDAKLIQILKAAAAGNYRIKAETTNTLELLDADDGSTVVAEIISRKSGTIKDVTIKI